MIHGNKRSTYLPLEQRIRLPQSVASRKSIRLAFYQVRDSLEHHWRHHQVAPLAVAFACVLMFLAAGVIVHAMGHPLVCPCGYVKLWHGSAADAEVSQHIADWYTPRYAALGILIYAGMWLLSRRRPSFSLGLLISGLVAAVWQVIGNAPLVVKSYAISTWIADYGGHSVVNSVADMLATLLGFVVAAALPVWSSAALLIAITLLPHDEPWFVVEWLFDW
jgi:hypothetical protein